MRAVVQRVRTASVSVAGERVAEMGAGLLVLVGVGQGDGTRDALELARKLVHLRVFEDDAGKINESLLDTVEAVADAAREHGVPVVTGRFGAMRDVELVNAGPMTLLLDTHASV